MKDKDNDIYDFRDEISELLRIEIASRYFFQKGKIEASFDHDKDIGKAVELLKNSEEYNKILSLI